MSAKGPERATELTRTDWVTPGPIFEKLNAEFRFGLDAAASAENTRLPLFLSGPHIEPGPCSCSLCSDWSRCIREASVRRAVWLNSPYGPGEEVCPPRCKKKRCAKRGEHCLMRVPGIEEWMFKCGNESARGLTVVALIPDAIDTQWFRIVYHSAWELRIVEGRIKFEDPAVLATLSTEEEEEVKARMSNTSGSWIAVWRPGVRPYGQPVLSMWAQPRDTDRREQ